MYIRSFRLKKIIAYTLIIIFVAAAISFVSLYPQKDLITNTEGEPQNIENPAEEQAVPPTEEPKKYIKWVDYTVPYNVMDSALNYDIKSYNTETKFNWIEILAYLGAKYGGDFSRYKQKDMDAFVKRIKDGESVEDITSGMKHYSYYIEAYQAILAQFVGEYEVPVKKENDETVTEKKYGLKVFSPIARGYSFSHYDDFGTGRSFGYTRKHLGNDLVGNTGTPIVAVESGTIEALGWNMYGGWRIGIRSFDKKRYYYYAHLRKGKPYQTELTVGKTVTAGEVIGYLGMTGYSTKENVNNIKIPHLHFGLQLIFDDSQKDGVNQIWIDVYDIVNLLQKHKSAVYKNPENNQFYASSPIIDPAIPPITDNINVEPPNDPEMSEE